MSTVRRSRRRGQSWMLIALLLLAGLVPAGGTSAQASDDALSGRTARIAGSDDGVNLRDAPEFGSTIIAAIPVGTLIDLRIDVADTVLDPDGTTRWWPVRVWGQDGWVAGYYLSQDAGTSDANTTSVETTDTAESADSAAVSAGAEGGLSNIAQPYARVISPDGANLRAEPRLGSDILAVVAVNTIVSLQIDQLDTVAVGGYRWWPVAIDGQTGWLAGSYLAPADAPPATEPAVAPEAAPFGPGDYVAAQTDDGLGANIRAAAGTVNERIGYVAEHGVVQVMDGPYPATGSARGWFKITDGTVTGFVDGDLLTPAPQPAEPAPPPPAPTPTTPSPAAPPSKFSAGAFAAAVPMAGLNIRDSAHRGGAKLGLIPSGSVVEILAGPVYDANGEEWYRVDNGQTTGYANGTFLAAASGPITPPPPPPAPAAVPGVATGSFMYPLASFVLTQAFGCSPYAIEPWNPTLGCNYHNAIDIAAPAYTPVMAADGGVVKYAGWCDCGLGFYVEIDHGNGFSTIYGHMAEQPWVATGQAVAKGEAIGPVGSTGVSTGPHTHFTVNLNGNSVDPLGYLPPLPR